MSERQLENLQKSSRRQGKRQAVPKWTTEKFVGVRLDEQTKKVLDEYATKFSCYWAGQPSLKRLLEQVGQGNLSIVEATERDRVFSMGE
ncbi:MAG: hypothetical protein MUD14_14895 [Hydrococcus sp. Prado102]|nr:hypothetical protein [Hydrococcus sp. Prado102]